jgi:hypothetical protein
MPIFFTYFFALLLRVLRSVATICYLTDFNKKYRYSLALLSRTKIPSYGFAARLKYTDGIFMRSSAQSLH